MIKNKLNIITLSCIFFVSFNNIKLMPPDTETEKVENPTIKQLNEYLEEHQYQEIRDILYKKLEKDPTKEIYNWVQKQAEDKANPFFWYILARNNYYKINLKNPEFEDITNYFKAMTICLIRITQDIYSLKKIDDGYKKYFDSYNIYLNKFLYWWRQKLQRICPNFNEVINQVDSWFKISETKVKNDFSCPDWVTTPYTSFLSSTTIYFRPVDKNIKTLCTQEDNIKIFQGNNRDVFVEIFKLLNQICEKEKSDKDKWTEFLNLNIEQLEIS
ncbi:hypothetical protein GF322_02065 [Candidatus Dependentiae bacterium]|nr:hypothetical protein [Candidatus Dependentiae bacterium]